MMAVVYVVVISLLSDREILFDVLFALLIMAMLLGLASESYLPSKGKAQSTEALSLAKVVQTDLVSFRAETGRWPEPRDVDPDKYGIQEKVMQSIAIEGGSIVFAFAETAGALSGRKLAVRAAERKGMPSAPVVWVCGYARAPENYMVHGENVTDIPREMLPEACRN